MFKSNDIKLLTADGDTSAKVRALEPETPARTEPDVPAKTEALPVDELKDVVAPAPVQEPTPAEPASPVDVSLEAQPVDAIADTPAAELLESKPAGIEDAVSVLAAAGALSEQEVTAIMKKLAIREQALGATEEGK
jgi:hypothetical protein